jgi:DNA-binding CsgD family transcriptional regulator
MSVASRHPREAIEKLTLANVLTPMQFRTVLLVACGFKNCEIGEILGTTEHVIDKALNDVYDRARCRNSAELVLRYVREMESGLLELGRLRRELLELEARAIQIHHACSGHMLRHVN